MAYDNWQDIYDKKSDEELYKICKGYEHPTFEQKELALKALEKRGFDFEKADEKIEQWRKQSKQEREELKEKHPFLNFIMLYFPLFFAFIAMYFFFEVYAEFNSQEYTEMTNEDQGFIKIILASLGLSTLFMVLMFWMLNSRRKKRK